MTGHKKEVQPGVWRLGVSAGKDPITGKYKYLYQTVKGGPHIADQELARLVTKSKQLGPVLPSPSNGSLTSG